MSRNHLVRTSKFLSLVLRHRPDKVGLTLDAQGWVPVEDLLSGMATKGHSISHDDLRLVVSGDDKKRYAFNADETMIRASQGHSVKIDLDYSAAKPPDRLFHGTVERFLKAIRRQGLKPKSRHHVHLSKDIETATKVGTRRGKPVILSINARNMSDCGYIFFCLTTACG